MQQEGQDGLLDAFERISDGSSVALDPFPQSIHATGHRGMEKYRLAGIVAVDGSLAYLKLVGQQLSISLGIAMLGKETGSDVENILTPLSHELRIYRPSTLSGCSSVLHPSGIYMTDRSVNDWLTSLKQEKVTTMMLQRTADYLADGFAAISFNMAVPIASPIR